MQVKSTFEDLVRQRAAELKQQADSNRVDWNERKVWWVSKVEQLLDTVQRDWLRKLIDSGTLQFTKRNIRCSEEVLGEYEIACAKISLGGQELELQPKATVIVGGFGRIDAKGPNGSVMLLLCAPDTKAVAPDKLRDSAEWYVTGRGLIGSVISPLQPLNKASFEQLFADLFGIGN